MNPMHLFQVLVVALVFGIASTVIADTGEGAAEQAQVAAPSTPSSPLRGKGEEENRKTAALQKSTNRIPKKAPSKSSNFIRLSHLILGDAFAFGVDETWGNSAFDSAMVTRLLASGEAPWISRQIGTRRFLPDLYSEEALAANAIEIQSLDLDFSPFDPLSGALHRPVIRGRWLVADTETIPFEGIAGNAAQPLNPRDGSTQEQRNARSSGTGGGPLTYRYAMDSTTSLKAGVNYVPDLDDTKGSTKLLEGPDDEGSSNTVSGVNLNLGASYKAMTLTGGYVRALDNRTFAELALGKKENDPIVWNSEIAYSTELLSRETTLALGYQKSSDSLYYYLPEERYKTRASMALSKSTTFSLEYYQDRDATLKNGEEDGYGITTKIGFDF